MSLVESRSHIIHVIPSDKITEKNDSQTEYVYNSVGVIEALVVILSTCCSLKVQETCHQTWNEIIKRSVNIGIREVTFYKADVMG